MNTVTETQLVSQTKTISLPWLAAWAVASGIGLVLGATGSLQLIWNVGESIINTLPMPLQAAVVGAFLGLGIGLTTGLAQWLVLRARGIRNSRWLLSNLIGGTLGGVVIGGILLGLNSSGNNPAMTIAAFVVLGAVLGGAQLWMAREIAGNALWIVASAVGLGGSIAIMFGTPNADPGFINIGAGALVYGSITGAALWWGAHR